MVLPDRVPCTAKHLHDGKPCGECDICELAKTSPKHQRRWGVIPKEEPEAPPKGKPKRHAQLDMRNKVRQAPKPTFGAGTELKRIFEKGGFREEVNCGCEEMAKAMNEKGLVWCDSNVDEIIEGILENAKKRNGIGSLEKLGAAVKLFFSGENELVGKLAGKSEKGQLRVMVHEAIRRASMKQRFDERTRDTEHFIGPSPPNKYCSKYHRINRKELKRSLYFHIWPANGDNNGELWRWHIQQIGKYRELFNGTVTIGLALGGDNVASHREVVRELDIDGLDYELIHVENNPDTREYTTFQPFLNRIDTSDPNEITLISQSKGVTHRQDTKRGKAVAKWCDLSWRLCCEHPEIVVSQLENYAITGPFRKTGGFDWAEDNYNWHYSGSFCWIRNSALAGRDYKKLDEHWGAIELWPGRNFAYCEAGTIFLSGGPGGRMDMYSMGYWDDTVLPGLEEWHEGLVSHN